MNDAYVSFKTSKLLKNKGFSIPSDTSYEDCIWAMYDEYGKAHWGVYSSDWYFIITQQMACNWLKEEKGIYISVVPDFNEYGEYPDDLYWFARVYDLRNGDYIHSTKLYKSSQETFEATIQYVLTNLI